MTDPYGAKRARKIFAERYEQYLFRTGQRFELNSDDPVARECARYGLEVVFRRGKYLIGKGDDLYGSISPWFQEEGINLVEVIAGLFVTGPFDDA